MTITNNNVTINIKKWSPLLVTLAQSTKGKIIENLSTKIQIIRIIFKKILKLFIITKTKGRNEDFKKKKKHDECMEKFTLTFFFRGLLQKLL